MKVILNTSIRLTGDRVIFSIAGRTSAVIVPGVSRMGIDPLNPTTWHYYDPSETVAASGQLGVSRETVWRNLLEEPYPTFALMDLTEPVGGRSTVFPFGTVTHFVDHAKFVIFNVTARGHWLYLGLVIRALSDHDGQWVITTIGCGNGRLATINRLTADYVWGENARRIGRESIYEEARARSRRR